MLFARTVGPATYGVFGIGWTLFQLTGLVAALGLDHGAVRYASRHLGRDPERIGAVLRRAVRLALISGVLCGGALALAAPLLSDRVYSMPALRPVLFGFSVGVALLAGLRVAAAGTRVSQRMRFSTLAEDLALPITHLVLLAGLLALGWRLAAGVAAPVAASAVAFALALGSLRSLFPAPPRSSREVPPGTARPAGPTTGPTTGQLLAFSTAAALSGLLGLLTVWADRLLVGALLSDAHAGIYTAASQISLLFAVVLSALNTVFAPMIAELYSKGETRELESLFRISTRWGLYLALPMFLVVLTFPAELLGLLGDGYAGGARAVAVLAVGQMINLGTGAVGVILVMSGRQNRLLALSATTLVLNVLLNLLWIPRFGLTGAALATAVSLAVLFSAALLAVRRSPGVWPYDRRLLKGVLATLAAAAVLVPLRLAAGDAGFWHLAAAFPAAYGAFAATLALRGLDREDRELLGRLVGREPREGRTA
jgi:O-antigen/teichoic acid export membrane protein